MSDLLFAEKAFDVQEGQIWSYKTRAGEEHSVVLINKVETGKLGETIYHVSVDGIHINDPETPQSPCTELPHAPVSQHTLNVSLVALVREGVQQSNFLDGYRMWNSAYEAGKAGVFTCTLAELVDCIEQAVKRS